MAEYGRDRQVVNAPASMPEARRQRQGVRSALDHLERAVAAPSTGREEEWAAGVAHRLAELQSAFGHHIRITESPEGLLSEIAQDAPRLQHGVEQLRNDHVSIQSAIDRALAAANSDDDVLIDTTETAMDVMARIVRHRHEGASLVYDAYTVDIDAAD